jgi:hypothetical protein
MIRRAKLSKIPSFFFKEGWLRPRLLRSQTGWFSLFTTILALLVMASPLQAQDVRVIDVPNPMSYHTWFIIGAVGAFLIWSISYALQLQKEAAARNKDRGNLLQQKEELLDRIADLEAQKESGAIADHRYKHELKELRFRLSKVLGKIAHPEAQKSAKKTS